jgi:hypothetical protein
MVDSVDSTNLPTDELPTKTIFSSWSMVGNICIINSSRTFEINIEDYHIGFFRIDVKVEASLLYLLFDLFFYCWHGVKGCVCDLTEISVDLNHFHAAHKFLVIIATSN